MNRILKRIVYALGTLGLGAFLYALLRNEGERVLAPVKERLGAGRSGGAGSTGGRGASAPRAAEPAEAVERSEGPKVAARPAEPVAVERAAAEPDRCAAETKSGARCARPTLPGSKYCWQHAS